MQTKKVITISASILLSPFLAESSQKETTPMPNVIFIAVDDLNDWVGAFGGNLQVKTPNLDKFYSENAMIFTNAHCPGPVCCPSRSSLLSGFRPETTGCYRNTQNMLKSELVQEHATLPEYFSKNGYVTISKGKIFHKHQTEEGVDQGQWAYDIWEKESGKDGVKKEFLYSRSDGLINGVKAGDQTHTGGAGTEFAWGPTIAGKEETTDYLTTTWFADQLGKELDNPFFMAVGISKPHLPWYVPQEFFDMYKLDDIKIPSYKLDDLDDILTPSGKKKFDASGDFLWLSQDSNLHKSAIRAYLASVSYADACIGVLLDALKKSKYNDNTIVVIWGDHGWHLSEKLRFRKATLWTESTKMPLMIRTPEMKQKSACDKVINLVDMYPTLIDLCNLPARTNLDGRSFAPLIKNPDKKWPYPSITTQDKNTYTINNENWRYIHYDDGTEELYDLKNDPMEWTNLIGSKDKKAIAAKEQLLKWQPKTFADGLPENKQKINWKKFDSNQQKNIDLLKDIRPLETLK